MVSLGAGVAKSRSEVIARSLLEGAEHIDCFRELGDVQHPVLQPRVDPDFPAARPDGRHELPVERLKALLDAPELKACHSPGVYLTVGTHHQLPIRRLRRRGDSRARSGIGPERVLPPLGS